jgi:hypothetical protein
LLGLFLEAEDLAGHVEFGDAVAFRIMHVVGEDGGAVRGRSALPRI